MSSPFADLESRLSNAVDAVFSESTRIDRYKRGGLLENPVDGDRPSVTVKGIVDFNPVVVNAIDRGAYDGFQPSLAGEKIHVSYDLSAFDAGQEPKEKDVIVLLARPEQPTLSITRTEADGLGRIVCFCVRQ